MGRVIGTRSGFGSPQRLRASWRGRLCHRRHRSPALWRPRVRTSEAGRLVPRCVHVLGLDVALSLEVLGSDCQQQSEARLGSGLAALDEVRSSPDCFCSEPISMSLCHPAGQPQQRGDLAGGREAGVREQ